VLVVVEDFVVIVTGSGAPLCENRIGHRHRWLLFRMGRPRIDPCSPSPTPALPSLQAWIHEAELDGFLCVAQAMSSRLRRWTWGREWVDRLEERTGGVAARCGWLGSVPTPL
jgi:hypothetical protein